MLLRYLVRAIILSAIVVAVGSCRVGKDYSRPAVVVPEQFEDRSSTDTASVADLPWKQFFTDQNLVGLIDTALQNNHDLLIAMNRISIAQQQVKQSALRNLPTVDLAFSGQYNRPSKNSLNGLSANNFLQTSHIENYLAIVNLSWEADIWGKLSRQRDVAVAGYLQSKEATRAVQTSLVANIAQGYFNLLMLDRQLGIARRNVAISDSFLTASRLLKDAGEATALAVEQAGSQKQAAALLIPALEQDIAVQEHALSVLAGVVPGKIIRTSAVEDGRYDDPAFARTGVPAGLLSRRPDVRAEELQLVIANARTGIAQANMYPALNISAGAGLESFKASNWFSIPNSLFGLAAGTIVEPIFRRRELRTQYEVAKLEREQAVVRFRQSVLRAAGEVADALVRIQKLKEQHDIAVVRTDTLQRAVQNSQLLFKSDMANYLEVLIAQSNALQAELNLATIRRQQLGAVVELYRALGGGWM